MKKRILAALLIVSMGISVTVGIMSSAAQPYEEGVTPLATADATATAATTEDATADPAATTEDATADPAATVDPAATIDPAATAGSSAAPTATPTTIPATTADTITYTRITIKKGQTASVKVVSKNSENVWFRTGSSKIAKIVKRYPKTVTLMGKGIGITTISATANGVSETFKVKVRK